VTIGQVRELEHDGLDIDRVTRPPEHAATLATIYDFDSSEVPARFSLESTVTRPGIIYSVGSSEVPARLILAPTREAHRSGAFL